MLPGPINYAARVTFGSGPPLLPAALNQLDVLAAQDTFVMVSDRVRQRAETSFKQKVHALGGRKPMSEYEVQARATREKIARLKALRLANEAQKLNSKSDK
jgi:hypothetical protein